MKFNVIKADLIDKLQKVTDVIGSRSTLPILSNVLIEAENNQVAIVLGCGAAARCKYRFAEQIAGARGPAATPIAIVGVIVQYMREAAEP